MIEAPDDDLSDAERARLQRRAIAYELRVLLGLPVSEIAAQLGVSRNTISSDIGAEREARNAEFESPTDLRTARRELIERIYLVVTVNLQKLRAGGTATGSESRYALQGLNLLAELGGYKRGAAAPEEGYSEASYPSDEDETAVARLTVDQRYELLGAFLDQRRALSGARPEPKRLDVAVSDGIGPRPDDPMFA